MNEQRVYPSHAHMQVSDREPIRSVIAESPHAVIVAWHVEPGQAIVPHTHPRGQDTWTVLSGRGRYQIDEQGTSTEVCAGDVVVARPGQVHGVVGLGPEALRFISVVSPGDAGYEPLQPAP
jgi:quercetin dioxygenase-like cupin family protein